MLKKYNDTPAAVALGLFLLGALFYAVQLVFMVDYFLDTHNLQLETIPLARVLGAAYFGFSVGLILTFVNGPDGQRTFVITLLVAQVLCAAILWHARTMRGFTNHVLLQHIIAVSVLTALLIFGYFKLQSRL